MQVSPTIIVTKNLNSKVHKLLPTPVLPSVQVCPHSRACWLWDGDVAFGQSAGSVLTAGHKRERKRGRGLRTGGASLPEGHTQKDGSRKGVRRGWKEDWHRTCSLEETVEQGKYHCS